MVIKYKDKEITTLEDIQKLKVKELRDILKCNSERAGGTKADNPKSLRFACAERGEAGRKCRRKCG